MSAGLRSIAVRSGSLIDSLQVSATTTTHTLSVVISKTQQCYYRDGQVGGKYGGDGGNSASFDLDTDEYITSIEGRTGARVDALVFVTSKGSM